jgi:hypothetical protein
MECRFSVEAKTFSFSVISGKAVLRLEEKRKHFSGFILLGGKGSVWLADKVEEAIGDPKKGEFASSFSDEVRVLKLQMGSNRAGWFLEAAVFVEGNRKGVIRLPRAAEVGDGGDSWRNFTPCQRFSSRRSRQRLVTPMWVVSRLPMLRCLLRPWVV